MALSEHDIAHAFENERKTLGSFIARRINDRDQAEVILQTTFEKATQSLRVKSVNSVRAMLFVIAQNLITDHYRQHGFRSQFWVQDHDVETDVSEVQSPERQAIAQEKLQIAQEVINGLPEKCRHCFVENRFKFRHVDEIAQELELSSSMVKKYVQKAILSIQNELERRENE
ncbi:MAG: RNA polymerase sigma factor [Agarilytica sp.]